MGSGSIKDAGTLISVIQIAHVKPPVAEVILMGSDQQGGRFELALSSAMHLKVRLIDSSGAQEFLFQQVEFLNPGMGIVVVRWSKEGCKLEIADVSIAPNDKSAGTTVKIKLGATPILEGPSYRQLNGGTKCAGKIRERSHSFARRSVACGPQERVRSEADQVNDLLNARGNLKLLSQLAKSGFEPMTRPLTNELRALLCYGSDCNPLLFRLANVRSLGLPVYTMPKGDDKQLRSTGLTSIGHLHLCSIWRTQKTEDLLDFEEWLNTRIWLDTEIAQKNPSGGDRVTTPAQLIYESANTLGSSHYGTTVIEKVDRFSSSITFGRSLLTYFLVSVAEVAEFLSGYVLREFGRIPDSDLLEEEKPRNRG